MARHVHPDESEMIAEAFSDILNKKPAQATTARMRLRPKTERPLLKIGMLLVIASILIGGILVSILYKVEPEQEKLLPAISSSIPVYYPKDLPPGTEVMPNSIQSSPEVVIYSLKNGNGSELTITQQRKPDTSQAVPFRIIREFESKLGKGYVYDNGSGLNQYLIETENTWVLFSGSKLDDASVIDTAAFLDRL